MRSPSSSAGETGGGERGSSSSMRKKTPCCSNAWLKNGKRWRPEEDEIISNYIKKNGEGNWPTVAKNSGLSRCCKSIRFRYKNRLSPSVKHGNISPDEEHLILCLHRFLGNRWSEIAQDLPERTDNEIKNYYNTHMSKKLIRQGKDPKTHKPLNPDSSAEASSSKTNHLPTTNPNPNPASPVLTEETPSTGSGNMGLGSYNELSHEDDGFFSFLEGLEQLMDIPLINVEADFNHQQDTTTVIDFNHCSECPFDCMLESCDHAIWKEG